jgi:sodium/hydrogen antiporter
MEPYIIVLLGAGALILIVAWLPMVLKELPLSLPIFCVAIGYLLFQFGSVEGEAHPLRYPEAAERLTELVVIIALMGSGLKLDTPLGHPSWQITWRLLLVTMPVCIAALALMGWLALGLALPAAILLGAALAPTDPVLASDVQVGPPNSGEEDEVRFSLTAEAGLNDGLAFPFVNLALAVAASGGIVGLWALEWFALDVLWKLAAGIGVGWLVGRAAGYLMFRLPNRARLSRTGDGFIALGLTFLSYGLTEAVHGYGFLAVFVTALVVRSVERSHRYHERLHDFAEQTERLLTMVLLVLFGGALAQGLLEPLTLQGALVGLLFLFLIRPAAGLLGLSGVTARLGERAAVSFFGIRGIGTFYYLSYAGNEAEFSDLAEVWALAAFVVLVSIVLHGTTVTPSMRLLDRHRRRALLQKVRPPATAK